MWHDRVLFLRAFFCPYFPLLGAFMLSHPFRSLVFLIPLVLAACSSTPDSGSSAEQMVRLGDHLRQKGKLGGAMDFYSRALVADPDNVAIIKKLGKTLVQWGDKNSAEDVYFESLKTQPENGELRRLYGKLLISMERPAEARLQFLKALEIDSDDAKARGGLAVALDYLGEHAAAQNQYEKALGADPDNLTLLNNMAYSHILSRRYDRAIRILEPVMNAPEASAALRQNLALAYGLAGMDIDAERVARLDLLPEKVAEVMAYYRRERAEIKVSPAAYAELGTYATEALAIEQIQKLHSKIKKSGGDLRAVVLPEVSVPGGTPRFAVRMMGCSRPDDVSRLCKLLIESGIPCVHRGKGGE